MSIQPPQQRLTHAPLPRQERGPQLLDALHPGLEDELAHGALGPHHVEIRLVLFGLVWCGVVWAGRRSVCQSVVGSAAQLSAIQINQQPTNQPTKKHTPTKEANEASQQASRKSTDREDEEVEHAERAGRRALLPRRKQPHCMHACMQERSVSRGVCLFRAPAGRHQPNQAVAERPAGWTARRKHARTEEHGLKGLPVQAVRHAVLPKPARKEGPRRWRWSGWIG